MQKICKFYWASFHILCGISRRISLTGGLMVALLAAWSSPLSLHANSPLPIDAVVASSFQTGNTPANTIDGNPSTRWAANGIGQWIRYDLGEVRPVSGVEISWFNGSSRVYTFQVQTSEDATNWSTVFDGASSGQTTALEYYSLSSSEGRYLRIVVLGNSENNWASIYLTSIFGGDLTDEDIVALGLVSWNKPDGDGISCAECHTPFGYDVAIFDFDQEDLRRATAPHLTDDDADDIFAMIEVLRAWYPPAGGLKDVETFRPMQPANGNLLGGPHATLQERDDAFANYVAANFKVAQATIVDNLTKANEVLDELLAVDMVNLPVGIEMNRWSESVSRSGTIEGGRIAEWLPGIGLQPKSTHASNWNDLIDAYVAYPSDENFWAFFHQINDSLEFDPVNAAPVVLNRWFTQSRDLYKSNNVFTHNELNRAIGAPELQFTDGIRPFPDQDGQGTFMAFIWEVGDSARQLDGGGSHFNEMPLRHQETLYNGGGHAFKNLIKDLRTTWMWIGFTHNPVMRHSGGSNSARSLEYMIDWSGRPFRSHYAFAQAALVAKRGFYDAENNVYGATSGDFVLTQRSNFFAYSRYQNHTWDDDPAAYAAYRRIIANGQRAVLIRKTHEINTHGRHWRAEHLLLNDAETYRTAMNWADPANESLNNQIADAFILAVQSHPQ